jgi:hypothetical protein
MMAEPDFRRLAECREFCEHRAPPERARERLDEIATFERPPAPEAAPHSR